MTPAMSCGEPRSARISPFPIIRPSFRLDGINGLVCFFFSCRSSPGRLFAGMRVCHRRLPRTDSGQTIACHVETGKITRLRQKRWSVETVMTDLIVPSLHLKVIQVYGGAVDPSLTSRCTHLLCESQVSNMYVQVRMPLARCALSTAAARVAPLKGPGGESLTRSYANKM